MELVKLERLNLSLCNMNWRLSWVSEKVPCSGSLAFRCRSFFFSLCLCTTEEHNALGSDKWSVVRPSDPCAETPEILKQTLGIRNSQIKRFLATPNGSSEEIIVLLSKVSSHDIKTFVDKLNALNGASSVQVVERKRGEAA